MDKRADDVTAHSRVSAVYDHCFLRILYELDCLRYGPFLEVHIPFFHRHTAFPCKYFYPYGPECSVSVHDGRASANGFYHVHRKCGTFNFRCNYFSVNVPVYFDYCCSICVFRVVHINLYSLWWRSCHVFFFVMSSDTLVLLAVYLLLLH